MEGTSISHPVLVLIQPTDSEVLSIEVDSSNQVESEYRVWPIFVDPGTYHEDILTFPPNIFHHLPKLPDGDWMNARIFRKSGHLVVEAFNTKLKGATTIWSESMFDLLSCRGTTLRTCGCRQIQLQVRHCQDSPVRARSLMGGG